MDPSAAAAVAAAAAAIPPTPRPAKKARYGNATDGNALSTQNGYKAAIKCCDKVMRRLGEPLISDLTEMDAKVDNLTQWFSNLATGLASEETLKSNNADYDSDTLCAYLKKAREVVRRRFPENATVSDDDFFKTLLKNLPKVAGRRTEKGMSDDDVAVNTMPVYRKSDLQNAICLDSEKPNQITPDLVSMNEKLWRTNKKGIHELRAQLNVTYSSDGRGGEIKFVTYKKMYWESQYQSPVAKWFQQKQICSTLTCWTSDYEHPEACVFHSLGSFWCAEDGLARQGNPFKNENSGEARQASYMFPHTREVADASVAQNMTRKMKDLVSKDYRPLVSAKSLRIGASTALSIDRLVTFDEGICRGGWSTQTSRDFYAWAVLSKQLAPMMSLSGHPDATAMPSPPTLDVLPIDSKDLLQKYLKELYVISVPYFFPGGKLRPFLYACTACLIMHFPAVLRKYTTEDKLVSKMISGGFRAGLGATPNAVVEKLKMWAKVIQDDYDKKNAPQRNRDRKSSIDWSRFIGAWLLTTKTLELKRVV